VASAGCCRCACKAAGAAAAIALVKRLALFQPATSLGGTESLAEHRKSVEGADSPTPDDLVRLSIGIEDADELLADVRAALVG
jgi:cystathionine gamma-synthase